MLSNPSCWLPILVEDTKLVLKVWVSVRSTSAKLIVPEVVSVTPAGVSSVTDPVAVAMIVGASLVPMIVTETVRSMVPPWPSSRVTVKVSTLV